MFSSSENYCLFVHKRYGGLVEGHLFDTEGNARMILSAGNKHGPKAYGCSRDCDRAALVFPAVCRERDESTARLRRHITTPRLLCASLDRGYDGVGGQRRLALTRLAASSFGVPLAAK